MAPGSALPSTTPRVTSSTAAATSREPSSAWGMSTASRVTTRSVRRRSMAPPSRTAREPVKRGRFADAHGQDPGRGRLATLEHRRRPGLALQLTHGPIGGECAVQAAVDLRDGRGEAASDGDGEGEHVRLHVPGLADDDTGLHPVRLLDRGCQMAWADGRDRSPTVDIRMTRHPTAWVQATPVGTASARLLRAGWRRLPHSTAAARAPARRTRSTAGWG